MGTKRKMDRIRSERRAVHQQFGARFVDSRSITKAINAEKEHLENEQFDAPHHRIIQLNENLYNYKILALFFFASSFICLSSIVISSIKIYNYRMYETSDLFLNTQ